MQGGIHMRGCVDFTSWWLSWEIGRAVEGWMMLSYRAWSVLPSDPPLSQSV